MSSDASNPSPQPKARRWSVLAAGFLLLALAVVVIYTTRREFTSPLALVIVASIGLAALLMRLWLRKDVSGSVRAPLWLNAIGLLLAIAAVFADRLRLRGDFLMVAVLGAVICFGISGTVVLRALRKNSKSTSA